MATPVTIRCAGLVLALALSPALGAQGAGTVPAEAYAARRAALSNAVGNGVVAIAGEYLINPGDVPIKQAPDFWYLTGAESPYAILLMVPRAGRPGHESLLFLPDSFQFAGGQFPMDDPAFRRARWNIPRQRHAPGAGAARSLMVDAALPLSAFAERFRAAVETGGRVLVPLGDSLFAPPGMAAPSTRARQWASSLRGLAPAATYEDLTPQLEAMRNIKDRYEVAALRRAAEVSGEGMLAGLRALRPGMNDRELAGLMEYQWKRAGSPRSSFPPIVSSGRNAMTFFSLRREHYDAVDRVMQAGDLVFVDYGAAEWGMYTADLCRTWPVSGRFTPEQRRYYDIVLEAQEAAIAAIRPGVMMLDVIKAAARVFQKHGLERYEDAATMGTEHVWGIMPSPTHYLTRDAGIVRYNSFGRGVRDLGHHIGLEVQDSRDYSRPLAPGMVVTIEPKIYIPDRDIAIMIEDEVLVTETGHDVLSKSVPKRADEIERVMARARSGRQR